jgi:hypothetical protein
VLCHYLYQNDDINKNDGSADVLCHYLYQNDDINKNDGSAAGDMK